MTGLIRKDFYCLKRGLKTFLMVSIGLIVISVLFILSARYGNVAKGIEEMKIENNMEEKEFYAFYQGFIWCVLALPMSFLGIISECFKEDKKAGFSRPLLCMPLNAGKIVGSRYISSLLLAGISLADSLLAGFFVSLVSDVFSFSKILGYILCLNGALIIYTSLQMLLTYAFGAEKADLIQCAPFVILLVLFYYFFQKKISGLTDAEFNAYFTEMVNHISELMVHKCVLVFLFAIGCLFLSFLCSWMVFCKRKGAV